MTDSPFGECNFKLESGSELTAPKIILNTVRTRTVNLHLKYCEEMNYVSVLSDRSCMGLWEAIKPSVRKSMKELDNYAAEGGKAFDDMKTASSILGQIGKGKQWEENVHQLLNDGKQYLKVEYKSSEVSDHCCPFALSHDDQKYSRKCEHTHGRSCTECEQISSVLGLKSNATTIAEYENKDQKDEV
ncbi:Hypothetical predicted protein [Mytilus galloprovincialis]|uniref:Uncharacterized protein n=1 Tax=Mytilus galloprovincialis TaxID=29158 RepID=A0A8B6CAB8_MYTGA|nr:Hypothetical predicted protein [Mytilus galloprovincialis]